MVLDKTGRFQYNDSDKAVIVVELLNSWEVSVLHALEWQVRICVSENEFVGKLIFQHMSKDTSGHFAHHGRAFLSQLDHSQHVAPPDLGDAVYARAVLSSDDVLVNQILSGGAVDHND